MQVDFASAIFSHLRKLGTLCAPVAIAGRPALEREPTARQYDYAWPKLYSRIEAHFRREGAFAIVRNSTRVLKQLAYQILYDSQFDRGERWPSGPNYLIRKDEVVGPAPDIDERLYRPFSRLPFLWSIQALGIDVSRFSFVDFGSGRGRLILTAGRLPFQRIIGVEFARSLHQQACENIAHYPKDRLACSDIMSLNMNAITFDLPAGDIGAFFFNPFTGEVLDRVAQRIEDACRTLPRSVYIIFANSNRTSLFIGRPAFVRFRPSIMHRIRLAMMAPVPIEFFCIKS